MVAQDILIYIILCTKTNKNKNYLSLLIIIITMYGDYKPQFCFILLTLLSITCNIVYLVYNRSYINELLLAYDNIKDSQGLIF